MFGKNEKKVELFFHFDNDGFSGNSTSVPLSDGQLAKNLKYLHEKHGELVIESIGDNRITVTTPFTERFEQMNAKIDDIGYVVKDSIQQYVKNQSIKMSAYAVFAKGELKGVFGKEVNSRLKKSTLLRKGFQKDEIEIKPIQIGSFEDFK